ncbi:fungal-specific transcription factor domain-containing protein [Xylariaceae sp. AK1471]|nr:fungal-specific transcription factor domain-containing protein [Xylariaceae sp. AK1471]
MSASRKRLVEMSDMLKPNVRPAKRSKINLACQWCRAHKRKCDGVRPACGNCQKKESLRIKCNYSRGSAETSNVANGSLNGERPLQGAFIQPASQENTPKDLEPPDVAKTQASPNGNVPVLLAKEINAAVNSRLGLADGGRNTSTLFPLANAPLFGSPDGIPGTGDASQQASSVLPPRRQADELLNLYWKHIQTLDPVLDQDAFTHSYSALFAGDSLGRDENVFASTLNTVFAMSTQLQSSLSYEQREQASNIYFRRAWALLRPETVIWEPGTCETVQCLLLMSRYLQCTNNMHYMWMLIGSAVRIAQSLGLHITSASLSGTISPAAQRRKQLWEVCIMFDRQASILLGRTPLVSASVTAVESNMQGFREELEDQQHSVTQLYWHKTMEIMELNNHIALSHTSMVGSVAQKYDLLPPYRRESQLDTILRLSGCLRKWEDSISPHLRWEMVQSNTMAASETRYRQALVLHLRLLHVRIFLFRPILWYLCLSQPQGKVVDSANQSLEGSMMRQCVTLCIESAQKMIALIYSHQKPGADIGIMPWWNRIFYVYIAATILTAAMLRPEFYTSNASLAWDQVMFILDTHEHLSPFIRQSRAAFQTLSRKILDTHYPSSGTGPTQPREMEQPQAYLPDVFPDVGLDATNFLLGMDDINWLFNFDYTQ